MIVDLDAHQGNGHERDHLNDPDCYIVDAYNHGIYPASHPIYVTVRSSTAKAALVILKSARSCCGVSSYFGSGTVVLAYLSQHLQ